MGFESKSLDSFKIASKIHFLDGEMAELPERFVVVIGASSDAMLGYPTSEELGSRAHFSLLYR